METSAVAAIHPLCVRARVPQIAPLTSLLTIPVENTGRTSYLVRMSPTETLKAKVIADIVKHYKWQTMAVLGCQDKEGVVRKARCVYECCKLRVHEWIRHTDIYSGTSI